MSHEESIDDVEVDFNDLESIPPEDLDTIQQEFGATEVVQEQDVLRAIRDDGQESANASAGSDFDSGSSSPDPKRPVNPGQLTGPVSLDGLNPAFLLSSPQSEPLSVRRQESQLQSRGVAQRMAQRVARREYRRRERTDPLRNSNDNNNWWSRRHPGVRARIVRMGARRYLQSSPDCDELSEEDGD